MQNFVKGLIFDIQRYCIEDGPGVRTTVFLKGCPLSCPWCSNPESQKNKIELMYTRLECSLCGTCIDACEKNAICLMEDRIVTDRLKCDACGDCVSACPNSARRLTGYWITPEEAAEEVALDSLFFMNSGGGVTLSGGECLQQGGFVAELLRFCKKKGIHTVIDTCGYASEEALLNVLKSTDLVLFDIKHMDSAWHKKFTGVGNERILGNARLIDEQGIRTIIRYPVIPGFNDDPNNVVKTGAFVKRLGNVERIELLPYHEFGSEKYRKLDRHCEWQGRKLAAETLDLYIELLKKRGINSTRI